MGNDKRYQGTFTKGGLVGKVFMRKPEVMDILQRAYGDSKLPEVTSDWTEVASYGGCKVVARKSGAVTRYAMQHYGHHRCCQVSMLTLEGHATYGTSKASMPVWMRSSLDGYWTKGWGRAKVLSWTRSNDDRARAVVQSPSGMRYEITLERGLTDGSNLCHDISTPFTYEQLLAGEHLKPVSIPA